MTEDLKRTGVEVQPARVVGRVHDILTATRAESSPLYQTVGAPMAARGAGETG